MLNLTIKIDRLSDLDLQRQICSQLKEFIESGKLPVGTKLPSSRDLADELKVARKTIKQAYAQMCLEGYLISSDRQGTYVREFAINSSINISSPPARETLSQFGKGLAEMALKQTSSPIKCDISLFSRHPDFDRPQFENVRAELMKELKRWRNAHAPMHQFGCTRLREAIANVLAPMRDINCTVDQIVILPGFIDALNLITNIHVDKDDSVLLEEPCYPAIRELATAYGAKWLAVPTDREGLTVDKLPTGDQGNGYKLGFVTPGHHFPTGGVLPFARRLRLLEWARETGCYIVDDDYDSEFTYAGRPAPALKSLDRRDQVIHLSSFKKLVPPMFSVDFIILPLALVPIYAQAMNLCATTPCPETQNALAHFIESGAMVRHTNRMKLIYARRRQLLMQLLQSEFLDDIEISGENSGLHFLIRIRSKLRTEVIVKRASELGLEIVSTRDFYAGEAPNGEFIIGFGTLEDSQIEEAVARLKQAAGLAHS